MSQTIFIWSSYGDIGVYALNTIDDYQKLYNQIKEVLVDGHYIEPESSRRILNVNPLTALIKKCDKHIEKFPNNIRALHSCISEIVNEIEPDDNFGYGTELSKLSKMI